jgi:REP element-mobilizing transposase RayT
MKHPQIQHTLKQDYWIKFETGCFYHVYNRSINRERLFKSPDNYEFFLRKVQLYIAPYFDIAGYCLLPNHFHFLLKVKLEDDQLLQAIQKETTQKAASFLQSQIPYVSFLEDQFKRLFSSYALAFNKQQGRRGSIFQKRFKRKCIDELSLPYVLAYIHHNPIHHFLTDDYTTWQYSSYLHFLEKQSPDKLTQEVLCWFGDGSLQNSQAAFKIFHEKFKAQKTAATLQPPLAL